MSASITWHVPAKQVLERTPDVSASTLVAALTRAFGNPPWQLRREHEWGKLEGLAAAFPCLVVLVDALANHGEIVVEVDY